MEIHEELAGGPQAAHAAREAALQLAPLLPAETMEDLRLLVSELVTNSVRHGGVDGQGRIFLQLRCSRDLVRVDVVDPGPGFDRTRPTPRIDQPGGWGLVLVDRIANRWGVDRAGHTHVWFEIDLGGTAGRLESVPISA